MKLAIMLLLMNASCSLIAGDFTRDSGGSSTGDDVEVLLLDGNTTSRTESEALLHRGFTYSNNQESNSEERCRNVAAICLGSTGACVMLTLVCFAIGPCGQ